MLKCGLLRACRVISESTPGKRSEKYECPEYPTCTCAQTAPPDSLVDGVRYRAWALAAPDVRTLSTSLEYSRLQARTLRSRRTCSGSGLAVSKRYAAWAIIFALSSPAISAGAAVSVRLPSPPDALCSAVMGCGCCDSQSSSAPACACAKPCVLTAYLCGRMRSRLRSPPSSTRRVLRCALRAAPSRPQRRKLPRRISVFPSRWRMRP